MDVLKEKDRDIWQLNAEDIIGHLSLYMNQEIRVKELCPYGESLSGICTFHTATTFRLLLQGGSSISPNFLQK